MTLRARAFVYLVAIHAVFMVAVVWAAGGASAWLIAVEAAACASLAVGIALTGRVLRGLDYGNEAERLIHEGDFTARLRPIGDPSVDRVIDVYNRMVDTLRGERARIQEQDRFLEEVIGASPSGIVILDFDGRVSEVNPAALRLLGVTRDEVAGCLLVDVASALASTLARLPPGGIEVVGRAGTRLVRCQRGSFVDRGFPRAFFVIEELTDEARRIERAAYEKLVRVMSHEVNNSITATNSLLESSLTYASELPAESRTDLEGALRVAIDRSAQLNQFMRQFADVFKLPPPHREPTELRTLLSRLATLMRARSGAVRISTEWAADAVPVWMDVDQTQFEQACLNVLKNGIEAAGPDGTVRIALVSETEAVVLTIDDTGPGPGTEAEAHLFSPFFSTKPHGQGIGLTLVQEILSGHGFGYALEHLPDGPTRFSIRMTR